MSGNVLRYVGQTLAAWLRAFASRIEPKAHSDAAVPPESSTDDGPPAHWLERVRKDAPQLLQGAHPLRTTPEQPSERGRPRPQQATPGARTSPSAATASPTVGDGFHSAVSPPTPNSSFPSADSRAAAADKGNRANIPSPSRPTRPDEPAYPAPTEKPVMSRLSSPFRRPLAPAIQRPNPPATEPADNKFEPQSSQLTASRFPARVLSVERSSAARLQAFPDVSKATRSFSEPPRWPTHKPETASVDQVHFSAPGRPPEKASPTFRHSLRRPAPNSNFTTMDDDFVHEIPVAALAFSQEAQPDRWPALPMARESAEPPEKSAADLAHLQRLALEQKGKLWIA